MLTAAARYRFPTTWLVDAPIERSWDTLDDAERWPALGELAGSGGWRLYQGPSGTASTWEW